MTRPVVLALCCYFYLQSISATNLNVVRNSSVVTVSHQLIPLLNSSDVQAAVFERARNVVKTLDEAGAEKWLVQYEAEAQKMYSSSISAGWIYFNNLTEENRLNLV